MREMNIGKSSQQRGAVLIVALIMLLLLTLVGIAGIRDTQLQEKMAGGTEDRAIAFQAAESALREAEKMVESGSCTIAGGCDPAVGYYEDPALPARVDDAGDPVSEAAFWATWFGGDADVNGIGDDWDDLTKVKSYAGTVLPQVAQQPRYVIELLPPNYSMLPNTANSGGGGTIQIHDFLITARGTGRTNTTVVILQSVYRYSSI